jgi:hypothetical protein
VVLLVVLVLVLVLELVLLLVLVLVLGPVLVLVLSPRHGTIHKCMTWCNIRNLAWLTHLRSGWLRDHYGDVGHHILVQDASSFVQTYVISTSSLVFVYIL